LLNAKHCLKHLYFFVAIDRLLTGRVKAPCTIARRCWG
jgi:hypothetical protein